MLWARGRWRGLGCVGLVRLDIAWLGRRPAAPGACSARVDGAGLGIGDFGLGEMDGLVMWCLHWVVFGFIWIWMEQEDACLLSILPALGIWGLVRLPSVGPEGNG